MTEPGPLIEVTGLVRDFGPIRAVDGVDLRVGRGEILGLLGVNGAGKSTTLRMICGTLAPGAGSITIGGADLLETPRAAKRMLGYLPDEPPVYGDMTVTEFLDFCAGLRGLPRNQRRSARERAIERCGLDDVARRLIGNLSRGYRQRLGLAQAILHDPPAIVLDEPTTGLDPIQNREIRALIREIGQDHAVILSTHVLPEVRSVCSHVQIMHRGRIAFSAALTDLDDGSGRDSLLVHIARPPATGDLTSLPGVTAVEVMTDHRVRLRFDSRQTDPERIARSIVNADWGLLELSPDAPSLEQIFVNVTAREAAAAEPA